MSRADSRIPPLEIIEAGLLKEQRKRRLISLLAIAQCVLASATAALTAVLFLPIVRIDGISMAQTLQEGNLVIGRRTYEAEKGDVIAFYHGDDLPASLAHEGFRTGKMRGAGYSLAAQGLI